MLKGVFFDLDGTLLLTENANYVAYRDALSKYNRALSFDVFKCTKGQDSRDFLKLLFPELPDTEIQEIRIEKARLYLDLFELVELNKPIVEILKANQDKISAIVTNAKSESTLAILNHFGLLELIDKVFTGDLVTHGKPDSSIYLRALSDCSLESNEVVAFEDSIEGVNSASGAGISVVRVPEFNYL